MPLTFEELEQYFDMKYICLGCSQINSDLYTEAAILMGQFKKGQGLSQEP